jgi:hypothetical protein
VCAGNEAEVVLAAESQGCLVAEDASCAAWVGAVPGCVVAWVAPADIGENDAFSRANYSN